MSKIILEIAVFNVGSALLAAGAGADRLELCENPGEGGTTPSYGTLKVVREKVPIPVFPIIRPRGGDFLYSEEEMEVIKKDLLLCKELGFEGVVTGALTADGNIHAEQTKRFVELAYPMELTFHRAFDRAADPLAALEILIGCGCSRVLTSGQVPGAFEGKELLKALVTQAANRIIVMPGSGVRSSNIAALAQFTGATEMHSSARKIQPTQMQYSQTYMDEKLNSVTVDAAEIASMKSQLQAL